MKFTLFICLFYCVYLGALKADNKEDAVKEEYKEVLEKCTEENPITEEDMKSKDKTDQNTKCIFACALKKTGMMDEKGLFSAEGIRKSTEKYLSGDPDLLQRTEKFIEACENVNDVTVSDGVKGCDRALLIYQCTIEKAPNFKLF